MKRFLNSRLAALLLLGSTLAGCSLVPVASSVSGGGDSAKLTQLLDEEWEWASVEFPELATAVGDHRFDGRLSDVSLRARSSHKERSRTWLANLEGIRDSQLSATEVVTKGVAIEHARIDLDAHDHEGLYYMRLNPILGAQSMLPNLLRLMPAETDRDFELIIARFEAYPRRVQQEIDLLRQGMEIGWRHSQAVIQRAIAQLDVQIDSPLADSPFLEPAERTGSRGKGDVRDRWRTKLTEATMRYVLPAQRELRDFLVSVYLKGAPQTEALSTFPGGRLAYEHLIRAYTTLPLTASEIHARGIELTRAYRKQMESAKFAAGFSGDLDSFVRYLNSDSRFFLKSEEELLSRYRDILKRIEPELPRLFGTLPRFPVGVVGTPRFFGPGATATYVGPTIGGSRAGWVNVVVTDLTTKPIWGMEVIAAHEGVPGHHLQVTRALEQTTLPNIRRASGYMSYSEGWALYAESLGFEIGLYKDPYAEFGFLQAQALRAARLVVDTGLHVMGWSRQQAIDYLFNNTGIERIRIAFEVDRYLAMPGQALAYTIGKEKFVALRMRAQERLGCRFDIRRFHDAVLETGSVPLGVLDKVMEAWETSEAAHKHCDKASH